MEMVTRRIVQTFLARGTCELQKELGTHICDRIKGWGATQHLLITGVVTFS